MYRKEKNILRKILHQVGFIYKITRQGSYAVTFHFLKTGMPKLKM